MIAIDSLRFLQDIDDAADSSQQVVLAAMITGVAIVAIEVGRRVYVNYVARQAPPDPLATNLANLAAIDPAAAAHQATARATAAAQASDDLIDRATNLEIDTTLLAVAANRAPTPDDPAPAANLLARQIAGLFGAADDARAAASLTRRAELLTRLANDASHSGPP